MPFIMHHNDDDGRCSAAIIYNELHFDSMKESDFFEYAHGYATPVIDYDALPKNDIVYILDLALDPVIAAWIQRLHHYRPDIKIIHIDHHISSQRYLESAQDYERETMSHVKKFYRTGISASLLCWTYCQMTEEMREDIEHVYDEFDYTDGYSHVGFNIGQPNERDVRVPMIIRFINDWDVWNHELPGTRQFHYGFSIVKDKGPTSKIWSSQFYEYNDYSLMENYVTPGASIEAYMKSSYEHIMKHAFEFDLDGVKILCINATDKSSLIFGDKIKEYPAVCVYQYQGDHDLWNYSMYSDNDTGIDVSKICTQYGGGGHPHAAGFQLKINLFAKK